MTEQKKYEKRTEYEWVTYIYGKGEGDCDPTYATIAGFKKTMSYFEGADPLKFQLGGMEDRTMEGYGHIELHKLYHDDYYGVDRWEAYLDPIEDGSLKMKISYSDFKIPKRILKQIEKYNAGIKDKGDTTND
tara:strand:+ start:129 stop:524 length:396 start_codon:yes stop_codon:yes gene_type:complete